MAENELEVVKFLFSLLGNNSINLKHIGKIESIQLPLKNGLLHRVVKEEDLNFHRSNDPKKKADCYINHQGISLKQEGGSFAYNRIERAEIINLLVYLNIQKSKDILHILDEYVVKFHEGSITRNQPWDLFFQEADLKKLLKFLMLKGNQKQKTSSHPAIYILEAPKNNITVNALKIYTFDEYFNLNYKKITVAFRRQWIGQASNSEHKRALKMSKNLDNNQWVFNSVAGEPRTGWQNNFPENHRKTVYFLMLEKH